MGVRKPQKKVKKGDRGWGRERGVLNRERK